MSHLLLSRATTFATESDGLDFASRFEDVLRYYDASESDVSSLPLSSTSLPPTSYPFKNYNGLFFLLLFFISCRMQSSLLSIMKATPRYVIQPISSSPSSTGKLTPFHFSPERTTFTHT